MSETTTPSERSMKRAELGRSKVHEEPIASDSLAVALDEERAMQACFYCASGTNPKWHCLHCWRELLDKNTLLIKERDDLWEKRGGEAFERVTKHASNGDCYYDDGHGPRPDCNCLTCHANAALAKAKGTSDE